jgi:hypothetical protein
MTPPPDSPPRRRPRPPPPPSTVVAVVNGHEIKEVASAIGRIFVVAGRCLGFGERAAAEAHARAEPPGPHAPPG